MKLHSHIHVQITKQHMQDTTDTMNNRRAKNSLTKYLPLTLLQGFEKSYSGFACERELETEQKLQYFDPHSYDRHVVSFLFSWCSTESPEAHSAGWWLPLLHLISNFSGPKSIGVPEGPLGRVWLSLPHLVLLRLELELAHSIFEIECLIVIKRK